MPWLWGKNYQGQPDDGEEPPESPDQAVDPQAAPTSDPGDQDPAVLPQPKHREQINLPPAPPQTEQHGHISPPPARAQPKHREQINLPPAPPQAEQHDTTGQGDVDPPADRGDQERVVTHEQFVVQVPPGEDPEAYVRSIRDQIAQKFQGRPVQVIWEQSVMPAPAQGPGHREQINVNPPSAQARPEQHDHAVSGSAADSPAAGKAGPHDVGGGYERPLYSGRERVRPAVALDGGTVGTWTVRGGWAVGSGQRPAGNCADNFALWCQGSRFYVAVATGASADPTAAVTAAAFGVFQLIDVAHAMPGQRANSLLAEQQKVFRHSPETSQLDGLAGISAAIGIFPQELPAHGRGIATLAAYGPHVGAWILGANGTPATVLEPGRPGLRAQDSLNVLDGDVVCIAASGLARPADGSRLTPLWNETPDEPAFLRFLLGATRGQRDGAALVAMWSGHYEVTLR